MDVELISVVAEVVKEVDSPTVIIAVMLVLWKLNGTKRLWKETNDNVKSIKQTLNDLPCEKHGEDIAFIKGQHSPSMKVVNSK